MAGMSKAEAGRLGGLATVAKHGAQHMQAIGKRGAAALWQRYGLRPFQLTGWALVDKQTGEIKKTWGGRDELPF